MMKITSKGNDAEIKRLKVLLIQRDLDSRGLSELSGVSRGVIQNILCNADHCWPPRRAINAALGESIFQKPVRAQRHPHTSRTDQKAVLLQKITANFAGLENNSAELQAILEKLGLQLVVLRFAGDAASPVWKEPGLGEILGAELDASGAGSFDSSQMAFGSFFCYFHVAHLAKALGVLKRALESRGLLGCCTILHAETESGFRIYWPPTAALLDPSDSDSDS